MALPAKQTQVRATKSTALGDSQVDPRFAAVVAALAHESRYASVIEALAGDVRGRRRGFGQGTLRVDGKIFAMMSRGRLVVKLPRARVDALVTRGDGEPFDPGHGRRMKEWLAVTNETLAWLELVREAHDFVSAATRRAQPNAHE